MDIDALAKQTLAEQHADIERLNRRNAELKGYLEKQNAEVDRLSKLLEQFHGLEALVRYRRKEGCGGPWNMAAFDVRSVADRYAADCAKGEPPWEYWVEDIKRPEPQS